MRNVLLAALMVSSLAPLHDADACGAPEPVVYRLSSHVVTHPLKDSVHDYVRTFALVPEIATGTPFANPVTLTLVGPSRTRVVTSKRHVSGDTGAIEVPQIGDYEHFEIALSGAHASAKWHTPIGTAKTKELVAWVTAHGVIGFEAISTSRVRNVEAVTLQSTDGKRITTFVRRGTESLGRFDGHALGAFELDGLTKLVIADGANVQTLAI